MKNAVVVASCLLFSIFAQAKPALFGVDCTGSSPGPNGKPWNIIVSTDQNREKLSVDIYREGSRPGLSVAHDVIDSSAMFPNSWISAEREMRPVGGVYSKVTVSISAEIVAQNARARITRETATRFGLETTQIFEGTCNISH